MLPLNTDATLSSSHTEQDAEVRVPSSLRSTSCDLSSQPLLPSHPSPTMRESSTQIFFPATTKLPQAQPTHDPDPSQLPNAPRLTQNAFFVGEPPDIPDLPTEIDIPPTPAHIWELLDSLTPDTAPLAHAPLLDMASTSNGASTPDPSGCSTYYTSAGFYPDLSTSEPPSFLSYSFGFSNETEGDTPLTSADTTGDFDFELSSTVGVGRPGKDGHLKGGQDPEDSDEDEPWDSRRWTLRPFDSFPLSYPTRQTADSPHGIWGSAATGQRALDLRALGFQSGLGMSLGPASPPLEFGFGGLGEALFDFSRDLDGREGCVYFGEEDGEEDGERGEQDGGDENDQVHQSEPSARQGDEDDVNHESWNPNPNASSPHMFLTHEREPPSRDASPATNSSLSVQAGSFPPSPGSLPASSPRAEQDTDSDGAHFGVGRVACEEVQDRDEDDDEFDLHEARSPSPLDPLQSSFSLPPSPNSFSISSTGASYGSPAIRSNTVFVPRILEHRGYGRIREDPGVLGDADTDSDFDAGFIGEEIRERAECSDGDARREDGESEDEKEDGRAMRLMLSMAIAHAVEGSPRRSGLQHSQQFVQGSSTTHTRPVLPARPHHSSNNTSHVDRDRHNPIARISPLNCSLSHPLNAQTRGHTRSASQASSLPPAYEALEVPPPQYDDVVHQISRLNLNSGVHQITLSADNGRLVGLVGATGTGAGGSPEILMGTGTRTREDARSGAQGLTESSSIDSLAVQLGSPICRGSGD